MTLAPAFRACSMVGIEARDAGVGGDLAVLDRHVEVGADEHALALEVEVGHADELGHVVSPEYS